MRQAQNEPKREEEHKDGWAMQLPTPPRTHGGDGRQSRSQVSEESRSASRSLCSASGSPAAGAGPAAPAYFLGAEFGTNACGSGGRGAAGDMASRPPPVMCKTRSRLIIKLLFRFFIGFPTSPHQGNIPVNLLMFLHNSHIGTWTRYRQLSTA